MSPDDRLEVTLRYGRQRTTFRVGDLNSDLLITLAALFFRAAIRRNRGWTR